MVEHIIPTSLEEALQYINTHSSILVSGGTDLMVQKRNWAELPPLFTDNVVYIFNLQELKYIQEDEIFIYMGATTPLEVLKKHPLTPHLLKQAIDIIASPALRNMATIAGNIGNASPAGDTLPILYAVNAKVKLQSLDQERIVPIEELILAPRKTSIGKNEMITEIQIPKTHFTKEVFRKVGGRQADAISKVSFTGAVTVVQDIVKDLRIVFGAVGPVMRRSKVIEEHYTNISVSELKDRLNDLKTAYTPLITPIDDQRSNKEYRLQVALNLLEQFINEI